MYRQILKLLTKWTTQVLNVFFDIIMLFFWVVTPCRLIMKEIEIVIGSCVCLSLSVCHIGLRVYTTSQHKNTTNFVIFTAVRKSELTF